MKVNYKFKTKPFKHQIDALRACTGKKHFGFFMESNPCMTTSLKFIGAAMMSGIIQKRILEEYEVGGLSLKQLPVMLSPDEDYNTRLVQRVHAHSLHRLWKESPN